MSFRIDVSFGFTLYSNGLEYQNNNMGCGNFPFREFLLLDFLSKELPTSDPISGVRDSPPGPYVLIVTVRLKIFNFVIYKCIFRKRNSSVKTYDIQCYSFIHLICHINSDHGVIYTILLIVTNRLKKNQFCDIYVYFGNGIQV